MEITNLESTIKSEWKKIGVAEVADRDLFNMLPGITKIGLPSRIILTSYELKEKIKTEYNCQEVRLNPTDGFPMKNVDVYIK